MLNKELVEYTCDLHKDDSGLVEAIERLLAHNGNHFAVDVAEALDNVIEIRLDRCGSVASAWLASLEKATDILSRFLYGRFLARRGRYAEAIEVLQAVAGELSVPDPLLLLHLGRLSVRAKRFALAADYLKQALLLNPSYSLYVKSEKLLQKIIASGEWQPRRVVKIALLGSSTTSFLASVLQACCFKVGIHAVIHECVYGNYRQAILDSASALYSFNPHVVILVLNHRDLALTPVMISGAAEHIAEDLRRLREIIQQRNPCQIIHVGFDLPPYGSWGCLEDVLSGGRARVVNTINSLLSQDLPSGVSFCDMNRIAIRTGDVFISDIDWYLNKQYPSLMALPVLADHLVAHVRASSGCSAKVLVLDLDNTLWGGIIGEDGLSGITVGPPSPEGESFLDLQRFAKELKDRGVLLAVCSKNNLEDAELPFKAHDAMALKLDDFVVFAANWRDKASNIQEIAQQLSLGLESFVFLDDNPLERAWVRSRLPDVIVPECGNKPWEMLESLRRGMYFEAVSLTEEDCKRHKSYKSNLVRKELEKSSASVEDFLEGLGMCAASGPIDAATLVRVTQLINKTNQFNLTTRRYSEEQVKLMAESPEWWTRWFKLADKFGDHGLIGLILAKKGGNIWNIDTWLMSCRVLGREVEKFMFGQIMAAAIGEGVREIIGEYVPTVKNGLVKDMYPSLGFVQEGASNRFVLRVTSEKMSTCDFIKSADV